MRTAFASDSGEESLDPQQWLQVERGKRKKFTLESESAASSSSSIEALIKVPAPRILPFYKPVDYVRVLAKIHKQLESCPPEERSNLYLLQYQVFKGLGESKLMRRSLRSGWMAATTVYEKLVFAAWLKYEKQDEEIVSELLSSCGKCSNELDAPVDIASEFPANESASSFSCDATSTMLSHPTVTFVIGDETVVGDRQKMARLSVPFNAMLTGCFTESMSKDIDFSENNISPSGMRAIRDFSETGRLDNKLPPDLLLEIMAFANRFFCEAIKDACDRKLVSLVASTQDAVELVDFAFNQTAPALAASCLQVFLQGLPGSLDDARIVELLNSLDKDRRSIMVGPASYPLYSLLAEVAVDSDPASDLAVQFLNRLVDCAETNRQKMVAHHQLGCVRLSRKEYKEAERSFEAALQGGHVYSSAGLARLSYIHGHKWRAYEKIRAVALLYNQLGWVYQEESLYCRVEQQWAELHRATELDPTLTYPYMFRAAALFRKHEVRSALAEIDRVLGFKLALECLELRCCFYLALEDYQSAMCDVQAILTLNPDYRMFDGRVLASHLRALVYEHVEKWTPAECWLHLYDRWSLVDDIGSLSVIYQMLDSDATKGVLYFRQSLLLLRLNCPEAAMRSLSLARRHASSESERLVYEGWILYDTGHCEEGLRKAEESINLQRSFEAFFLKAYALADSSQDPSCSSTVISLLEEALKCPSDRLRKGQALNNLGSVYIDCNKLDEAADCYMNALNIRHTRAHQGLARVHFLRNDKDAAYAEMTKLIEKARNNASAYEKRSEFCDRDLTKADLEMVTRLDPLRVYPYRYRAAVLMDNHKDKEAIAELSRATAFKADLHLLHLRAAFHEHIGDARGALRDCRAALSVDPNHQEMLELHGRMSSQEP
ncbi:ETO1-like protein 1 [Andrographis paniculata]|uniref:ETO1-like protein 1 n=1 Tax=Andrographis paniculata TaxID=175694 RepID=UPI0021E75690|nr:ETO1-like protein 1 [Andrographis paniculata]